ncbi:hypothetical protein DPMN_180064 [Dreissena polymorpha]|uniref:Uncharacterized protein n=1 Tax=Dreissena polymorpha TaxID=45954 RepID=A0A9D4ILB8_DREPO|nr:hypothetical protein DPMN_180064 [Dreissena polymorpha]
MVGELVEQERLSSYLESIAALNKAVMVRKGREVAKGVVEVTAAKNFLDGKFQMVAGKIVTLYLIRV